MKSLVIHGAEDIRYEDQPVPEPAEGQVRLRVKYVGICGSDLHYYYLGRNGENLVREPFVPGHELSATVDLDPSGELAPGTPVTVHPARYGAPVEGLEERPHLWPGGDYLGSAGVFPHRQGAAAEQLVVERDMVRVLPEGLSLETAALAEPLAVSIHAVNIAGDVAGRPALVLGAGPIGLLAVSALHHAGASEIVVGDVRPEPLERARTLGATRTFLVTEEQVDPGSFPVVLECSAAPVSLGSAVRAVAPGGIVVQVGILPDAEISVNLAPLLAKEAELRGTFRFSTEIDDAITLLVQDPAIGEVVTQVIPAADATEAFATARDASRSAKVLLAL
ncbi:L-idonate 5-dehydrogenase [Brachybacterium sp. NPDC056505]|jgi:L-idonate 5-dehydrogenase|uniref:L-idonate 5-dehydrogenase n=1 Tax=Brachybacterium sp. NPDC056505 TaxID=3345843 RepID=UPI003672BE99